MMYQHCYIGGGSEGLGLALACQLASKGAHVSIVSRSKDKLKLALIEIEVRLLSLLSRYPSEIDHTYIIRFERYTRKID
jgi:short-subunit dehydrogenase